MRRDTWADLAIFAAIADAGSFTGAAATLGVSPSALSHAMRAMEARLGVPLLNRTTRSVAPTEAGERLLATLRPAMRDLSSALEALDAARTRPAGRLRISAHRTAALHAVMPYLPRFAAACPDVDVELVVEDGLVDIVAGRFDAGVRHEHVLDQDMVSVPIGVAHRTAIVASPAYLAGRPLPRVPGDLLAHACLNYRYSSSGTIHRWQFARGEERIALDAPGAFVSNDIDVLLDAALAGLGIASQTEPQVAPHVAAGRLVVLLDDWAVTLPPNYLYYPGRRQVSAALRAFIDSTRAPLRRD